MAQFDPKMRRETRLLQELYRDGSGRPVYRMLPYCFVEYDGNPDRYIEALPAGGRVDPDLTLRNSPITDGVGQIVGFEYFRGRPFEAFSMDDFDAASLEL